MGTVPASERARGRADLALVAASAAAFVAAFPPLALTALAPVALVPLLVVAARVSPARAAGHGFLFGALSALGLGFWLPQTIVRFFGLEPLAALLAFAALGAGLVALPFAAFAIAVRRLARRPPVSPAAVAGLYGALELLWISLPVPNPWTLLAATQPPGSALLQVADIGGACGVAMLLAGANAVIAGFVSPAFAPRRRVRARILAALVALEVLGYAALRTTPAVLSAGEPLLAVTLLPGDLAQAPRPGHVLPDAASDALLARARTLAASPGGLVVWPELALGHSLRDGSEASRRLLAQAQASGADWLVGGPDADARATRTLPTNSVFLVHAGRIAGRYDKTALLPFAEARVLGARAARWSAGSGARSAPLPGVGAPLGVLLCSEALLPGRARTLAREGAGLLVNPSYDAWLPGPALEHELRIVGLRAIENRRPLVRAATGGPTAAFDAQGRVLALHAAGDGAALDVNVRPERATTLYQRIGEAVPLAGAALAAAALLRARAPRRDPRLASQKEIDRWSIASSPLVL